MNTVSNTLAGIVLIVLAGSAGACTANGKAVHMTMTREAYGTTPDGKAVDLYTLANPSGMTARIMTYGGIIVSLTAPDRAGKCADVVLGLDGLQRYAKGHPFFGTITGRYANRIGGSRFTLDGREYRLAANNGPNSLHGGKKGFDKVVWDAAGFQSADAAGVKLSHVSPDMDEGYPGALSVTVTYTLKAGNELKIEYAATTDKPTVLNLTNHTYFNLAGAGSGDVHNHEIQIEADAITPTDDALIPTGEIRPVKGTSCDFTTPHRIGERIDADDDLLRAGKGYDNNFILRRSGDALTLAARVYEPTTGRVMECLTTEPAVQLYTANMLGNNIQGKPGQVYNRRGGLCLETQHYPDSPNKPQFPSTVLRPGQTYRSTTVYRFLAR